LSKKENILMGKPEKSPQLEFQINVKLGHCEGKTARRFQKKGEKGENDFSFTRHYT